MKNIFVVVFGCVLLMLCSVQAYEDVTIESYRAALSEKLQEYGSDFDDCFPDLLSGFPSLLGDAAELDKWIKDNSLNTWYHRTTMLYGSVADEAFFTFKTEMSYFAVHIVYFIDEVNESITLYDVSFYGSSDGLDSDLIDMKSIPSGVSEKSLEEIAVCVKGTPGFEWFAFIGAVCVVFLLRKRMR